MYKVYYGLSECSFYDIFHDTRNRTTYNLRSQCDFEIPSVSTESYGKNSLRYLGPIIWNSIPIRIRSIETLTEFKKEIRKWKIENCPCRLCRNYIGNVGFL